MTVMKRIFDIISALILVVLLSIPLLVVAVLVRLSSKGPVIFWTDRFGANNRIFKMAKFRTMRLDAPQVAKHLMKNRDDYVTPIGKFLRKYSLDEIPQLLNILNGDMAFVGPRPALFNQHDLIELRTKKGIHKLLPGVTGWAQVNGRDTLSVPVKVEFDEYYLKNKSFPLDFKIVLMTFAKAIRGKDVQY